MNFNIYCDGACQGNGTQYARGGYAVAIYTEDGRLIDAFNGSICDATNNIAELTALIKACQLTQLEHCYTIYTDSAYIINCIYDKWYKKWLKNGWINSKKEPVKNQDLWEILIPYFNYANIKFKKVSGHAGILGNELVDRLAKAATKEEING